ncbi:T9SS type B sorting domain-containing protein [Fulvivirga lutea]|uniref:Gliding motility-associated C-terminal domain-containing protein n=1 Tax=Fulvivirga lutea TaxID=2810512 RepID=A0A974WJA2_9BACT|nr:gliding motility-associated C-terminal domain-containing protein [Fulvivirga lutea]QSE98813.1 gliding motility-associated C-terminal domain-containing protein [Fulvivirga lutea]
MKTLITTILICLSTHVFAQLHDNQSINYRIVAVSNDNPRIESVSNEVKLFLPMKLYLPSAFTPNNDGLNDTFGAVGEGIEKYNLVVYNRWGEPVFETNSASAKWDGTYHGTPVPFGSYTYKLVAYGKEFGQVNKTGSVMVIN